MIILFFQQILTFSSLFATAQAQCEGISNPVK
jgi:hypothetical protein